MKKKKWGAIVVIALLFAAALVWRRSQHRLWAIVWLVAAAVAIVWHTPQRWHEHLLLLPPCVALAAALPARLSRTGGRRMARIIGWAATVAAE